MAQNELARLTGIDIRQLRNYETNSQTPSLKTAIRLTRALRITLPELVGEFGGGAPSLAGEWWFTRDIDQSGAANPTSTKVYARHVNNAVELHPVRLGPVDDSGVHDPWDESWRAEMQLWDGVALTGWYAGAETPPIWLGALFLTLSSDWSTAEGWWAGRDASNSYPNGRCALVRDQSAINPLVGRWVTSDPERHAPRLMAELERNLRTQWNRYSHMHVGLPDPSRPGTFPVPKPEQIAQLDQLPSFDAYRDRLLAMPWAASDIFAEAVRAQHRPS